MIFPVQQGGGLMQTLHGGTYEVLRELGRGGSGRVLLVKDRNIGKLWAVKEMKKEDRESDGDGAKKRNGLRMQEAEVLLSLNHPGIVRIVSLFEENSSLYLVMDYVHGTSLKEIQKHTHTFSEDQVRKWGMELCDILNYMHSMKPAIVYRDLKPSNIILQENGHLILVDFGTAGPVCGAASEHTGTKGFASPEQYELSKKVDYRSDIYALGGCLLFLLTGKRANPGDTAEYLEDQYPQVSGEMMKIISKCISEDPGQRFQSAKTIREELKNYPGRQKRTKKQKKRRILAYRVFAAVCIFGVTCGCIMKAAEDQNRKETYKNLIEAGRENGSVSKRKKALEEAIALFPGKTEAYRFLTELFAEDGSFTQDEQETLVKLIEEGGSELAAVRDFAALSMEIGECYWYYADTDPDSEAFGTKGKIQSLEWFQKAYSGLSNLSVEDRKLVSEYMGIASFLKEIKQVSGYGNVHNDARTYANGYYEMYRLCSDMPAARPGDADKRNKAAGFVEYAVSLYRTEMICDGITESEIRFLLEKAAALREEE